MKIRIPRRFLLPAAAAVLLAAGTVALLSCGGSGSSLPASPRDLGQPLTLVADVEYGPGPPALPTCPDTCANGEDDDGDTLSDCDDLADECPVTTETGVDLCSDLLGFGGLSAEAGQEGIVTFSFTGQDDAGRAVSLSLLDVDTEAIGPNEGALDTPVVLGPCDFTASFELDILCTAECDEERLTLFLDEQPDPCDPGALGWGAADQATITEITIVLDEEERPRVLEGTAVAGTFSFTARNTMPTTPPFAQVQVSGNFRFPVAGIYGNPPGITLLGSDLSACP